MIESDLEAVVAISNALYADLPESPAVFAERLHLYPEGCLVLDDAGETLGYAVSHPWRISGPPPINALLGEIPAPASAYHLHDIALLPRARRAGRGSAVLRRLLAHAMAEGFRTVSLVAVHDSELFWRRHGFAVVDGAVGLATYGGRALFMARRFETA